MHTSRVIALQTYLQLTISRQAATIHEKNSFRENRYLYGQQKQG